MRSRAEKTGRAGFTLIELMIVVAVIGVLAAIAVPQFMSYRARGWSAIAHSDVKNAYSAAQAYFNDTPTGTVTTTLLAAYGFRESPRITLTVIAGTRGSLSMSASHADGGSTCLVDSGGIFTRG